MIERTMLRRGSDEHDGDERTPVADLCILLNSVLLLITDPESSSPDFILFVFP